MTNSVYKYLNDMKSDYDRWLTVLKDQVELDDDVPEESLVFLYLLYRDMYDNADGDIKDEFKWLIESERISVGYRGITDLMYLHDDLKMNEYILLLDDCLRTLEVPSEQFIVDSLQYINVLSDLDSIVISPSMDIRKAERTITTEHPGIKGIRHDGPLVLVGSIKQ